MLDPESFGKVYRKAVQDAVIETDLDAHLFPDDCPYTLDQVLDADWLPED